MALEKGYGHSHLPCTITIDLGPVSNITVESGTIKMFVTSIQEEWKEDKSLTSIKPTIINEDGGDGKIEISTRIKLVKHKTFVEETLVSESKVKIEGPLDQIRVTATYNRKVSSLFGAENDREILYCTGFKKSE